MVGWATTQRRHRERVARIVNGFTGHYAAAMASPPRLRLSIGANGGTKVFAFVVAAVTVATDLFLVLLGVMVVSDQFAKRAHDWALTAAVMFVGLSVAIYVVSAVAYVMLGVLRTGAWLDGTTLSMRVGFRTTSVDLATADVHCGLQGKTLIARDPGSGSTLTLALQGRGSVRLPSAQLRALAEAIGQGQTRTSSEEDPLVV
ncbi:MAG TPA: hypothetical protein VEL76_21660, partial [Gemmataceae bacterium]|nr:hypothetical protein [Gemmataceae bacterium]